MASPGTQVQGKPSAEQIEEWNLLWINRAEMIEELVQRAATLAEVGELEAIQESVEEMSAKLIDDLTALQRYLNRKTYLNHVLRQDKIHSRIEYLKKRLEVARRNPISFNPGADVSISSSSGGLAGSGKKSNTRLPKLDAAKYDGSALHFNSFLDMFSRSVDENENLSDIEKLQYLKATCTGEAAKVIESFRLTKDSYPLALEALKSRFGSESIQKKAVFKALREIKAIKDMYPVEPIKALLTSVTSSLQSLEQLHVPIRTAGFFLLPELLKKFPSRFAERFYRAYPGQDDNVFRYIDFVADELKIAELSEEAVMSQRTTSKKPEDVGSKEKDKAKGSMASCAALQNSKGKASSVKSENSDKSENSRDKPFKLECVFCEGSHYNAQCDAKLDIPAKLEIIKKKRLCYNCLRRSHAVKNCTIKFNCRNCGGRHHTVICQKEKSKNEEPKKEPPKEENISANVTLAVSSGIQLMVFSALIVLDSGETQLIRGLIDTGSHRSYLSRGLVDRLKLKKKGAILVSTQRMEDKTPISSSQEVFHITLKSRFGHQRIELDTLCANVLPDVRGIPDNRVIEKIQSFGLDMAEFHPSTTNEVEVILGGDCWWRICLAGRKRLNKNLGLLKTIFGWVLNGVTGDPDLFEDNNNATFCNVSCLSIEDPMEKLWSLESIGINSGEKTTDFVRDRFTKTTKRLEDGRYEVELPFNEKLPELDSNWSVALNQLAATLKKIDGNTDHKKRYDDAMRAYLNSNHAEIVPDEEIDSDLVYYIPHHPIIREDRETTKFRVVFNASSKKKGFCSLNECLYPGPSLNPDILVMLLRFRLYLIIAISDIQQAFLQVAIAKGHRNVLRFLWVKPEYFNLPFSWANLWNNLLILRMTVVPFGVNSSPFLLCASIRDQAAHFKNEYPKEAEALDSGIYMDDLMTGGDDPPDTAGHCHRIKGILDQAKMPLVKWASNSEDVHTQLTNDGFHMRNEKFSEIGNLKILGVKWNVIQEVLTAVASIFDPLGLLSPITLQMKLLLQKFWIEGIDWDVPVAQEDRELAEMWVRDIQSLKELEIERWTHTKSKEKLTIHIYCDASPMAFGCAVYIVEKGGRRRLLMSKCRIAPVKKISLPRLELTAAVVGIRIGQYLQENMSQEFPIGEIAYFSDSMIALAWIKSSKNEWKPYVSNRIFEINQGSRHEQWHYVSTHSNPADALTRPLPAKQLVEHPLWWSCEGLPVEEDPPEVNLPEEEYKTETVCLLTKTQENSVYQRIKIFKSFEKLKRVFVYVNKWKTRNFCAGKISLDELELSESTLLHLSQKLYFEEEFTALETGVVLNRSSVIKNLCPFVGEEGFLRLGGRLKKSFLNYDETFPIILHPDCWISRLLIRSIHKKIAHGDQSETLYRLRDRFWLLRARRTIKSVIRNCPVCRISKLEKHQPISGDLPVERTTPSKPFTNTGMDYMGPIYVKSGKKGLKTYILLFTCLVSRAIHLEVTEDLTVPKFLLAYRRFGARYGFPAVLFSDNARTFERGSIEIESWGQFLDHEDIQTLFSEKKTVWKFIPPYSPWVGGAWERMVRSVKDKLRKLFQRKTVDLEILQTVALEISSILNSRPLSYVSESNDGGYVLSPEHFLTGGMAKILLNKEPAAIRRRDLVNLEKSRRKLIFEFWQIWKDSYLKQLRNAHEVFGDPTYKNVEKDQVVLLEKVGKNPYFWPLARVSEVIPGEDGVVRVVKVIDPQGKSLVRSVKHVRVLELDL